MSHCQDYWNEAALIGRKLDWGKVERMARELARLRKRGGRLFIVGLGGSAANASHAVNDFRKLCNIEAYAPTDNVAELTARANDEGWHTIFDGWLQVSRMSEKDAVMVLSVGGGNPNVSYPIFTVANLRKINLLGIVGRDGGQTAKYADCCVIVPTVNRERVTPHTEAFQSVILHALVSHPLLQQRPTKW